MDLYPLLRVLSQPGDSLLLEFLFQKANLILSLPFPALFSKDSPRALLALNSAPNNSSDPPGTTPQPHPSCSHSTLTQKQFLFIFLPHKIWTGSLCLACSSNCSHFGFLQPHPSFTSQLKCHFLQEATLDLPPHSQLHTLSLWLHVPCTY